MYVSVCVCVCVCVSVCVLHKRKLSGGGCDGGNIICSCSDYTASYYGDSYATSHLTQPHKLTLL